MHRVGLFGGSFNPPHLAHQMVCLSALSSGRVDEVWLVPCHRHAFHKPLQDFEHRLEMCRRAVEVFGGRVKVSDVEQELGGPSHTLTTVRRLQSLHPDHRWLLVLGSDLLEELPRWHRWEELQHQVELLVVPRQGADPGPQPAGEPLQGPALPDISSTEIRERLRQGLPVAPRVPWPVLEYIQDHGLYQDKTPG